MTYLLVLSCLFLVLAAGCAAKGQDLEINREEPPMPASWYSNETMSVGKNPFVCLAALCYKPLGEPWNTSRLRPPEGNLLSIQLAVNWTAADDFGTNIRATVTHYEKIGNSRTGRPIIALDGTSPLKGFATNLTFSLDANNFVEVMLIPRGKSATGMDSLHYSSGQTVSIAVQALISET